MERDPALARMFTPYQIISTHALTWSATDILATLIMGIGISTHALTWSATVYKRHVNGKRYISTHALTWSATVSFSQMLNVPPHFNSRAHVERDALYCLQAITVKKISTHALTWSATKIAFPAGR